MSWKFSLKALPVFLLLSQAAATADLIGVAVLQEQMAQRTDVVVIDVRTPEEFAGGHVAGAINVPVDQINQRLPQLAAYKDRELVVYCRSGARAEAAIEFLGANGFRKLVHLDGDLPGWEAAGGAIDSQ